MDVLQILTIIGLCLWLAFLLFQTFWLSPIWNFSYHSYVGFVSPYSLVPQVLNPLL